MALAEERPTPADLVTVTDLERQVPGLREAYLKLAQGVPGE